MSKLTEIRRDYEKCKATPGDYTTIPMDWYGYLLYLLEEKDKALTFYADGNHYTSEYLGKGIQETRLLERGDIARKALNTSSNNEGEQTMTPTDKCPGCGEHLIPQWGGDEGTESYWEECQNPNCDYEEEQE